MRRARPLAGGGVEGWGRGAGGGDPTPRPLTSVMPRKAMPVCVSWLFHSTKVTSPFLCSLRPSQM